MVQASPIPTILPTIQGRSFQVVLTVIQVFFIGNTILMPQTAAISMPGIGPLTLIDNTIEGAITAAQGGPTVKFANGAVSIPNSYVLSMGNTYVSSTPFSVQNVTYERE